MKKKFMQFAACALIAGTGMTTTSCDSEILKALIPVAVEVVTNLLNGSGNEQVQTYSTTVKLSMYDFNAKDNTYDPDTEKKNTMEATATLAIYNEEETPCVTVTVDKMSVGGVNIQDFSFTTYWANGKIGCDPEDGSIAYLTGATCTYNGQENKEIDVCGLKGTCLNNGLNVDELYIQIGNKIIKGSINGRMVEE